MIELPDAVFEPDGDTFVPSEIARGPWDPDAQHGGAPGALIARGIEREPGPPMQVTRITLELLRPVPLTPLRVATRIARPGKKVQLVEASMTTGDGTEVVRALGLRIRRTEVDLGSSIVPDDRMSPRPEELEPETFPFEALGRLMFPLAMDARPARGRFGAPGPCAMWFRLKLPIVAGEETSPLMRVAAAADFGNGVSSVLDWDRYVFINPDLTISLHREPVGEWVGLDAVTYPERTGVGMAESGLYDELGRIGRATQSLLVDGG
ncbi:MAG: thioesterase family protein [Acidimicrobiia bacterium]